MRQINNSDVLGPSGRVQSLPGGRVVSTAIPVRELVRIAFGLGRWQEIRGPALSIGWLIRLLETGTDTSRVAAESRSAFTD